jgi:hypothetical protein
MENAEAHSTIFASLKAGVEKTVALYAKDGLRV